jgi:hypothetical protein
MLSGRLSSPVCSSRTSSALPPAVAFDLPSFISALRCLAERSPLAEDLHFVKGGLRTGG